MPQLGVGTIILKDRATVLLVKPTSGPDANLWSIPDGFINDQETVRQASIRTVKELTGLDIDAKQSLFFCETVTPDDHRVSLFCLAVLANPDADNLASGNQLSKWVDVRDLARIQTEEGLSDFSAQAFIKFSNYLNATAAASAGSTVN